MTVKKRRVFYLSGFDPRGADAYHRLFTEECLKQAALTQSVITVGPRSNVDALSSTWQTVNASGAEPVTTTFEFLRWDDIVRRHWKSGYLPLLVVALKTYSYVLTAGNFDYLNRIWRLSRWNFILGVAPALILFSIPLIAGMAAIAGHQLGKFLPGPPPWPALVLALLCAWGTLAAGIRIERRTNVGWLLRSYGFMRNYCVHGVAEYDRRIADFAERIGKYIAASDDDEIVIVGHSSGANLAVEVLARALDAQPKLLGTDSRVCLLTLGSTIPMQGLLAQSHAFRAALAKLSGDSHLPWVDVSSPHDVASFALHNPVTASGVTIDGRPAERPMVVSGAFGEVLTPETLAKHKYNVFRMHFQYLMAGEKPRANDYFSVTTGAQRFVERFPASLPVA